MKTKRLISGILVSLGVISFTWANYGTTTSSEYVTHETSSLDFTATYKEGKVYTTWGDFTVPSGQTRQYRKVIRSSKNANPVYPEDGYIYYGGNVSDASYTDENPAAGTNYYRVCAITQGAQRHRYCSNVKVLKIEGTTYEDKTDTTAKEVKSTLTAKKKAIIEMIVDKFVEQLNAKYTTDSASKEAQLQKIIDRVIGIHAGLTNTRTKEMFAYLIEKLQEALEIMQLQSILTIE